MIEPLLYRILMKPDKVSDSEAEKTKKMAEKAGLFLPEKTNEELELEQLREQAGMDKGTVVAIGATAFNAFGGEPNCKVGDYIAYAKHAGKWVKDPDTDEDFLIINDEDVVCKLTKKES